MVNWRGEEEGGGSTGGRYFLPAHGVHVCVCVTFRDEVSMCEWLQFMRCLVLTKVLSGACVRDDKFIALLAVCIYSSCTQYGSGRSRQCSPIFLYLVWMMSRVLCRETMGHSYCMYMYVYNVLYHTVGDPDFLPILPASLPQYLPRDLRGRLPSRQHQRRVSYPCPFDPITSLAVRPRQLSIYLQLVHKHHRCGILTV